MMSRLMCAVFKRGCNHQDRLREAHSSLKEAQEVRADAERRVIINEERNSSNHYAIDVGDALRIGRT